MSAYRFQLRDARASLALKSIAGICTDGDDFVSILNEVMERLMDRGSWWNTEWLLKICIHNGCITWPRIVGTVLGIRLPCVGEQDIFNNWWAIKGPTCCNDFCGNHTMRDDGVSPLYKDISCDGKQLRVFPTKLEDVGKTVVFYGKDSNQQPLQEKRGGAWQRGLTVTIQSPYGSTGSVLVSKVSNATKEVTQANVIVYEYDATSNTMRDVALWEPSETNPSYRRSRIHNFECIPTLCEESDGVRWRNAEAMVKIEFIPVQHDLDFLAVSNFTALKFGIQAVRLEEANQDAAAEAKWIKAIQALNFELRNKSPSTQFVVRVNPVGRDICSPI